MKNNVKKYLKNYLDLIPIQSKIHRRESLMTRICIFLSVFLVTAIFGMADMEIQSLKYQTIQTDGAWHACFRGLSAEEAAVLASRPEVAAVSRYDAANYRLDMGWQVEGVETVVCGFDKSLPRMYPAAAVTEGVFPDSADSVVCTDSIKERLGLQIGDTLTVVSPEGVPKAFTVSGFSKATSMIMKADAFGIFVNMDTFREHFEPEETGKDSELYIQFKKYCNIRRALSDIREQFGLTDDQVGENAKLLGLMFASSDRYLMQLYLTAGVLAMLVMLAGVLMITGSLNSSVAQRTEFFGLMRCLGATPGQVARFVRKEALGWCKSAIPAALAAGTMLIWFLCRLLRYLSPGFFEGMPLSGVSLPGMAAGVVIGLATVCLAARSPARRASKSSPVAAVSGLAGAGFIPVHKQRRAADTGHFPVDIALGIRHAKGSLKNFLLMTGSFAFGVILFLSFSVLRDFMNHALVPLRPWTADISVISPDNTCSLPEGLFGEMSAHPAVKRAYGRRFSDELEAVLDDGSKIRITLISYEKYQFGWAKDCLSSGDMEATVNGRAFLAAVGGGLSVEAGDVIGIETKDGLCEIPVSGVLSAIPFDRKEGILTLICSEALFCELTGERGYTIIDVQLKHGAADLDKAAQELRAMAGESAAFSDSRQSNAEVMGAYYAFLLFLYGFLAVILMICAFHIINSMSMSVSARMKQYCCLFAIGMSKRQIVRMIAAEAACYTVFGLLAGCLTGLYLHRFLFTFMVTVRWNTSWQIPVLSLAAVAGTILLSALLSLIGPVRQVRRLTYNQGSAK